MAGRYPLDGIEVVELGSGVAGPYAGRLMASYGADVLTIEPPDGNRDRHTVQWFDQHDSDEFVYLYLMYNAGKKSVAVDVTVDEGKELLWSIVDDADVVLENMRAGVMERLGFGWEEIQERNSELIYCSVTGYGEYGPYTDWPAYDPTIQAVSGWADQIGDGDDPELMDVPAIDHITALSAVIGILMALIERGKSGSGQRVNVSMFDAAVSFLNHQFGEYSAAMNQEDVETSYRRIMQPLGIYETKDSYIGLIVFDDEWETFCETIGRPEFAAAGHEFATNEKRVQHVEDLKPALNDALRERTTDEWLARLSEHAPNVPASPLNRVDDLWDDEHLSEREQILTRVHPEMGEYKLTRPPQRFSESTFHIEDAPRIGEHTGDILRRRGYSEEELQAYDKDGVIELRG